MNVSDLRGTRVVSVADAHELGAVDTLLFDLSKQQALAFLVRTSSGLFGGHKAVLLDDVESIGPDAITLQDASKLNDQKSFPALQNAVTAGDIDGSRVTTESGTDVGRVADIDVDLGNGSVIGYILTGSLLDHLKHEERRVSSSSVKSLGDKLIIIDEGAAPA